MIIVASKIRSIKNTIRYYQRRICFFLLPNIKSLKRLKLVSWPDFQQKTILLGDGNVYIGEGCCLGSRLGGFNYRGCIELQPRFTAAKIVIGNNVSTNNNICLIAANEIRIGDGTLIGQNVTIMDFEAHGISPDKRNELGEVGTVNIGTNVWIGNNAMVLKDTVIGDNSIIAAGAVVKGDFPENVIIGGVPAKIIKYL